MTHYLCITQRPERTGVPAEVITLDTLPAHLEPLRAYLAKPDFVQAQVTIGLTTVKVIAANVGEMPARLPGESGDAYARRCEAQVRQNMTAAIIERGAR